MRFDSKIVVEKYTVRWKIRNFDQIPFVEETITGPSITLGKEIQNTWTLLLFKVAHAEEESVGFCVRKDDENYHYEVVVATIDIKSDDGRFIECLLESVSIDDSEEFNFVSIRDLSEENRTIFKSEELTLIYNIDYVFHKQLIKTKVVNPEHDSLLRSMEYLHDNKPFSDITLCTCDNATIRCHKVILCSRSPLMNVLCKDLKKDDVLHLDIDGKTAKAMIYHIYTRQMPHMVTKDEYHKLRRAAVKFNLDLLKSGCEDMFKYGDQLECVCPECLREKDERDEFENNTAG